MITYPPDLPPPLRSLNFRIFAIVTTLSAPLGLCMMPAPTNYWKLTNCDTCCARCSGHVDTGAATALYVPTCGWQMMVRTQNYDITSIAVSVGCFLLFL